MKKLWVLSLVAGLASTPLIAAADMQAEIADLKARLAKLEMQDDINATRNYTIGSNMEFGVGSGMYGDELYINDFGLNRDLTLLHERDYINSKYKSFERAPHLLISGNLSGTLGKHSNQFGIEATEHREFMKASVEMDFTAYINEDWLGYFQFEADGDNDDTSLTADQIFVTYGNFDKHPMYVTLGYQYVPFGNFTTNFIEKTLVQELARTKVPAATGGFNVVTGPWDVNGSVFWYDGKTKTSDQFRLDEVGANLQARRIELGPDKDISILAGASVTNNLASSLGMSDYIVDDYDISKLKHYVPGVDVRAKIAKGPFSLTGEYVTATRSFSQDDLQEVHVDTTHSVKPDAWYVEAAYDFKTWTIPSTLSARYDQTSDALAFGLPEEQWGVSYQIAPFFNTRVTFEYAHKVDYSSNTSVTANGVADSAVGTSKRDDLFQAQINVFF